jgi:hypothetical protein
MMKLDDMMMGRFGPMTPEQEADVQKYYDHVRNVWQGVTMTYVYKNLEELAAYLEGRADAAEERVIMTKKDGIFNKGEAHGYRMLAAMLRDTIIEEKKNEGK